MTELTYKLAYEKDISFRIFFVTFIIENMHFKTSENVSLISFGII